MLNDDDDDVFNDVAGADVLRKLIVGEFCSGVEDRLEVDEGVAKREALDRYTGFGSFE